MPLRSAPKLSTAVKITMHTAHNTPHHTTLHCTILYYTGLHYTHRHSYKHLGVVLSVTLHCTLY